MVEDLGPGERGIGDEECDVEGFGADDGATVGGREKILLAAGSYGLITGLTANVRVGARVERYLRFCGKQLDSGGI